MIENEPGELTLIYHSAKVDDRKARGYVESLPSTATKTLDLAKDPITETQLAQVSDKLGVPLVEMVDMTYDDRPDHVAKENQLASMEDEALLTVLVQNPMLVATPILISGNKAFFYNSSYEFIRGYKGLMASHTATAANVEENDEESR